MFSAIHKTSEIRDRLTVQIESAGGKVDFARGFRHLNNADILSLNHTVLYGIKGVSAYAEENPPKRNPRRGKWVRLHLRFLF
jgi:hypothetical protein